MYEHNKEACHRRYKTAQARAQQMFVSRPIFHAHDRYANSASKRRMSGQTLKTCEYGSKLPYMFMIYLVTYITILTYSGLSLL